MPEYRPSSRLAKRPRLDVLTDSSNPSVPNPPPSVPMGHLGFQPSSKLTSRPKLNNATVASTSTLPETLASTLAIPVPRPLRVQPRFPEGSVEAVPPSKFYGMPALASPFGGYDQEADDRHVRFKNPLVEGTPLHIRQMAENDNRMEGVEHGNVESHSPPSAPLPPPIPFKSRPRLLPLPPTLPIVTIPPTPLSPASPPINFPSTPDHDIRGPSPSEERPSPKWPPSAPLASPTTEDTQSTEPDTEEDEQRDQLGVCDDDDEVEIVEGQHLQEEAVKIVEAGNVVRAAGKVVKGKEKAVEDGGEARIEESAASFRSFLLRPSIEELIRDLNLESGSGEAIRGVEVRTTAKEKKADLLSRLLEAELYLAAGIEQLHDCLKTFVASGSKIPL